MALRSAGGGVNLASPGAIGGTTPAAGTFTEVTVTSGNISKSGAGTLSITSAASQNIQLSPGSGGTLSLGGSAVSLASGPIWGRNANAGFYAAAGGRIGWGSSSDNTGTNDIDLVRMAAGIARIANGSTGGGALQFTEMTAPTAPAANNAILFLQDNGAGKTQLMVLFPTGAAQQVAIEP